MAVLTKQKAVEKWRAWTKTSLSASFSIFLCLFSVCRLQMKHPSQPNKFCESAGLRPPCFEVSCKQIMWMERVLWLVGRYRSMITNRSLVRHEFTNTKKLVKKFARIEASSVCRQLFANVFNDFFCSVHTHTHTHTHPRLLVRTIFPDPSWGDTLFHSRYPNDT